MVRVLHVLGKKIEHGKKEAKGVLLFVMVEREGK
jgi:hypothetical protein